MHSCIPDTFLPHGQPSSTQTNNFSFFQIPFLAAFILPLWCHKHSRSEEPRGRKLEVAPALSICEQQLQKVRLRGNGSAQTR